MPSIRIDSPNGGVVKPRPKWLRALGDKALPDSIAVGGITHFLKETFKHDSWAATGLYEGPSGGLVVVKLHRQASVFGLPMWWLGRLIAQHEIRLLTCLADLKGIPALAGPVSVGGKRLPNAVARHYIEGHPLGTREAVGATFFPGLGALLHTMHDRKVAYIDLHKRENILVSAQGEPCLIDFQISVAWPKWLPAGPIFKILRRSDEYHLMKHWARCRPDQCGTAVDVRNQIPWPIRAHRLLAVPVRQFRRWLLVRLGVRSGKGRVETELFAEHALRQSGPDNPGLSVEADRGTRTAVDWIECVRVNEPR
jgi:hypothetical protein